METVKLQQNTKISLYITLRKHFAKIELVNENKYNYPNIKLRRSKAQSIKFKEIIARTYLQILHRRELYTGRNQHTDSPLS